MKLKYLLAASVVSLSAATILPAPVMAQQITSGVQGTVADDSGSPLGGATVTVSDTRTGAVRTLTTAADGTFRADGLIPGGPYTVSATAGGYEGQTVENVNLTLQGNAELSFALVGGTGEIVVSGTRANLTTVTAGPGQSFGLGVLETAPTFERDLRDVIRIDPRVSLDRNQESDRVSCLGGNDRANAFTVDGISQADIYGLNDTPFSTRNGTPVPYDAIRETTVEFAPYSVEYSGFTGCAINAVTKSGTNQIHGNAFITYSDAGMAGDNVAGQPASAADRDIRYGGTLGGPIIRDRLFLFGAYEHVEVSESQDDGPVGAGFTNERPYITQAQFDQISSVLQSKYGIDTGGLARSIPFTSDRYFVRADAYINDNHRIEATYQRVEEAKTRADDAGSFGTFTGLNSFIVSGSQSNYYSGRLYSNWADNFSTELSYARSEITDLQSPVGGGEAQDANPITRVIVGVQNGTSQGLFVAGPGFSRSANRLETVVNQAKLKARLAIGNHSILFGGEWSQADLNNLFVQNGTGSVYFRDVNALIAGTPNAPTSTTNNTSFTSASAVIAGQTFGGEIAATADGDINSAAAAFRRTIWSAYIQDEWAATDRLNVNAGVRVDWYDGDRPTRNPNFVKRYGFGNDQGYSNLPLVVQPRIAFDYDAGDFGPMLGVKLKAGVGIFSGGDPVVWFGNAFQNNGYLTGTAQTSAANCGSTTISVFTGSKFTGVPACAKNAASAQAANGLGDTQSIDPNLKMPTVLRANIGLSARLGEGGSFFSGWNLNLDYIYSKFRNPLTLVDLSAVPATFGGTGGVPIGLNGFAIDGRPIFRAIDPSSPGCTAQLVNGGTGLTYTNVNARCFFQTTSSGALSTSQVSRDDELQLTNGRNYRSQIASIILSKNFNGGVFTQGGSTFVNFGYAYTDSQDIRSMYRSTAGSNYDGTALFNRNDPVPARGFFSSKHNFTLTTQFKEKFFGENTTSFGFTAIARSGRPYSLTFGGSGQFYDSASGFDNALLYIPTGISDPNLSPTSNAAAVQSLVDYVGKLKCASKYAGSSIPRNTCENDWFYDVDLNFGQEFPGPLKGDSFRLSLTMDNFLNFLDNDWNVFRRRDFEGLVNVVSPPSSGTTPVDSAGRYIINSFSPDDGKQIQTSSSLWRFKVGLTYKF